MSANIYQLPTQLTGTSGVFPNFKFMVTGDNSATITTAGYMNGVVGGSPIVAADVLQVLYSFNPDTGSGTYGVFTVSISNGVITLAYQGGAGEVVLPTIANHIATYTNVTGTISEDATTAINGGNIQAGLSGTAGYLASFPGTAAKGSLRVTAVANSGDTLTTITNAAMGQASVITIPDPADATAAFVVAPAALVSGNFLAASGTAGLVVDSGLSTTDLATYTSPTIANHLAVFTDTAGNLGEDVATAINSGSIQAGLSGTAGRFISYPGTAANGSLLLQADNAGADFSTSISNGTMGQSTVYTIPDVGASTGQFLAKTAAFVNGNLVQASGTAGVCVDSGVAPSAIQLKADVTAATTANIGGAGAGPLTVTVAGLTTSSVVVATVATSSNAVSVIKAVAGTGNFDVTFSADPGATCTLNYVAYIVGQ